MKDRLIIDNGNDALNQLKNYIDYVKSKLVIKNQLSQFVDDIKFLVVEGKRDEDFLMHYVNKKYQNPIINISHVIENKNIIEQRSNIFKNNGANPSQDDRNVNSKLVILQTFNVFNTINLEKNNLYAVVDKDFDKEYPSAPRQRVYSDSVHDLECSLLSSDNTLIGKIVKNEESVIIANYMVYQLGVLKKCINNYIDMRDRPSLTIKDYNSYARFFDGDILNIGNYVEYINTRTRQKMEKNKNAKNKLLDKNALLSYLKTSKKITSTGEWKFKKDSFKNSLPEDFWEIINGHDYLNILKVVDGESMHHLKPTDSLEEFVVRNYNYEKFSNTELFKKLHKIGIID